MNLTKVTKAQVIARLKKLQDGEKIKVWFAPNKCYPSKGLVWQTCVEIELTKENLTILYPNSKEIPNLTEFDSKVNNFRNYNCNSELGQRVHFYIEE